MIQAATSYLWLTYFSSASSLCSWGRCRDSWRAWGDNDLRTYLKFKEKELPLKVFFNKLKKKIPYNYFFQICRTCAEISGSGLSNHADKSFGYCSRSNCLWWVWGPRTLSYGNLTKFFFCGCFRCCDRQDLPPLAGSWGRWRHQLPGLRQHVHQPTPSGHTNVLEGGCSMVHVRNTTFKLLFNTRCHGKPHLSQ